MIYILPSRSMKNGVWIRSTLTSVKERFRLTFRSPSQTHPGSGSPQQLSTLSSRSPSQTKLSRSGSLRPLSPPPNRDLWKIASECLDKKDKETIDKYAVTSSSANDLPEALFKAAEEKQRICEDKRWTFQFNGHQLILKDIAKNVVV